MLSFRYCLRGRDGTLFAGRRVLPWDWDAPDM